MRRQSDQVERVACGSEINKFLSDQKDAENVAALKIINGHYRDRFMKCKNIL